MDDDSESGLFFNLFTKKTRSKRIRNAHKYKKTCAIYGIFDCTCCKVKKENRTENNVIDETINLPSTSKDVNSDVAKADQDDIIEKEVNEDLSEDIDVGLNEVPITLPADSFELESRTKIPESISSSSDRLEMNESANMGTDEPEVPTDVMLYINSVYEDYGSKHMNIKMEETENKGNEQSEQQSSENSRINVLPATCCDPLAITTETVANTSIKSEVTHVTEEEEEIDVVNLPPDSSVENLSDTIENQSEIKTEGSDDENLIIDILNFDGTDRREHLMMNNSESISIMETTPNDNNEDEIIDVEMIDDSPVRVNDDRSVLRAQRRLLKRRLRSRNTVTIRNRSRLMQSLMTIDLINSSREDSIIEITDSSVVQRKVTEVIDIDDDNDEVLETHPSSDFRAGLGNCSVCLEGLAKKEIMSTICGHVYCARCITNVIKTTKRCPNCRKYLTLKSIHPLFI